jgi:uncharacterized protein
VTLYTSERPNRKRRALVTGASSGIGEAIARELAGRGWELVLTARSEERLARLATELRAGTGVPVAVIPADLTDPGAPTQLEAETELRGIPVDLLVNNAGIGFLGPFACRDPEALRALTALNVTAVTDLLRRFAPRMAERGEGWVLNVASTGAFLPGPGMAAYYASKAYVLSLSESLHVEFRPRGVRVTALCPGTTPTGFQARAGIRAEAARAGRPGVTAVDRVARAGVEGVLAGRRVVVPGWQNRVGLALARILPRGWLGALAWRFQRNRAG